MTSLTWASTAGAQAEHKLYAYDAYLLPCALAQRAPLLTLDRGLQRAAAGAGVQLIKVSA